MKARRPYVALTLDLATDTTQNLLALINAALGDNAECPGAAREVDIQSTAGNTASIYIGDASVSPTNYGYELAAGSGGGVGASRTYRAGGANMVAVGELYVRVNNVASQKLSVEIMAA